MTALAHAYLKAAEQHEQFLGTVLIARNGRPIFVRGYGQASIELGVPNHARTRFSTASITKQFTAVGILRLREQGKLKLEDSICQHIDDCPAAWRPVTLRHLLSHSSGVHNISSLPEWDDKLSRIPDTPVGLLRHVRDLPLDFEPGSKFRYSNSGYDLLGLVIERRSGLSYRDYLSKEFFGPLRMKETGFLDAVSVVPNRATGYDWAANRYALPQQEYPGHYFASGGIYSTVGDLLIWEQALQSDRLIPAAARLEMATPILNNYGYGLQIGNWFGRRQVGHAGSLPGFSSYLASFPDDRVTIVVLSNSDRASANRVVRSLAAAVFGAEITMPQPQLFDMLWTTIEARGAAAAIAQFHTLRKSGHKEAAGKVEDTLNELGYDLVANSRLEDGIAILRLNVDLHPGSANAHDSLGEAYMVARQDTLAIESYKHSIKLDPKNENGKKMLEKLYARSGR